jgi:hypothetical protein
MAYIVKNSITSYDLAPAPHRQVLRLRLHLGQWSGPGSAVLLHMIYCTVRQFTKLIALNCFLVLYTVCRGTVLKVKKAVVLWEMQKGREGNSFFFFFRCTVRVSWHLLKWIYSIKKHCIKNCIKPTCFFMYVPFVHFLSWNFCRLSWIQIKIIFPILLEKIDMLTVFWLYFLFFSSRYPAIPLLFADAVE